MRSHPGDSIPAAPPDATTMTHLGRFSALPRLTDREPPKRSKAVDSPFFALIFILA